MSEKKTPPHNSGNPPGGKKPDTPPQAIPPISQGKAQTPPNAPAPKIEANQPPLNRNEAGKNDAAKVENGKNEPPKTPPPAPPKAPPAAAKDGRGNTLSLIALAVAAGALVLGFVQHQMQGSQFSNEITALQKNLAAAQQSVDQQQTALAALRNDLAALSPAAAGLDRDAVNALIDAKGQDLQAALEAKTAAQLSALPASLARADVQSLIKQELATFAQNQDSGRPSLDFSDEIAKVQASEASAKQVLAQIEQSAAQLDSRVQQALTEAETRLNAIADSRNSALNLLTLAQLSAYAGQYQAAAQYAQQAASHLPGTEQASWQGALADAAQQYQQLAALPSANAALDQLIARVGEWPIRDSGQQNLLANAEEAAPQTLVDKVRHVGNEILANTVTVIPLDEEGLVWINENPALQNIIRQNVRLDLAFARNALQMQDKAAFVQISTTLKGEIERYFDVSHAEVAAALDTLNQLESAHVNLPDLAPLIQTLRSAN